MINSRNSVLHPFLITLLPILYIAAHNLSESPGKEIICASFCGIMFAGVLFLAFYWLSRTKEIAAFCTSFLIICLFLFGPIYDFIPFVTRYNELTYAGVLFFLVLSFFVLFSYLVSKKKTLLNSINKFLSIFSIIMLIMIIFSAIQQDLFILKIKKIPNIINSLVHQTPNAIPETEPADPSAITEVPSEQYPDIYYIILDAYARADVLKNTFEFDNTPFERALKKIGFSIPSQSTSNYPATHLSLASSLSMEHINELAEKNGVKQPEYYLERMKAPKIAAVLKKRGYSFYTISSGWTPTAFASPYSDYHFGTKISTLSNYYTAILSMTPLRVWVGSAIAKLRLFSFEKIKEISASPNTHPKFVFLHMTMPHLPSTFNSKGEIIHIMTPNKNAHSKFDYIDQLKFLNTIVLDTVETIVKNSKVMPIIILQGDHGSDISLEHFKSGIPSTEQVKERFSILNAYYGPSEFLENIYPSITPVNTFRVVLNYLNIGNYALLPDTNYFQWYYDDSGILDVTKQVQS